MPGHRPISLRESTAVTTNHGRPNAQVPGIFAPNNRDKEKPRHRLDSTRRSSNDLARLGAFWSLQVFVTANRDPVSFKLRVRGYPTKSVPPCNHPVIVHPMHPQCCEMHVSAY